MEFKQAVFITHKEISDRAQAKVDQINAAKGEHFNIVVGDTLSCALSLLCACSLLQLQHNK